MINSTIDVRATKIIENRALAAILVNAALKDMEKMEVEESSKIIDRTKIKRKRFKARKGLRKKKEITCVYRKRENIGLSERRRYSFWLSQSYKSVFWKCSKN